MLPNALAIGVPYDVFWHLTPKKLNAFYKAFKTKQQIQDEQMWLQGQYFYIAAYAATHNAIAEAFGKKGKAKYIEKPILQEVEEKNKPLSEEELQRQRELFVAKLEVMKTNFELSHPKN